MTAFTDHMNGLGLYWWARLGESAGTTIVDQIGAHNGTYGSTVVLGQTSLTGDADTSVYLPGDSTNGYGSVPSHSSFNQDTFSAGVKFKFDPSVTTFANYPLLTRWNGASQRHFGIDLQSGPNVRCYVGSVSHIISVLSSGLPVYPSEAEWLARSHWLCMDYDGTTLRLYLDGLLLASQAETSTSISGNTQPIVLGWRSDTTSMVPFKGWLDEAFLGPPLTAEQHRLIARLGSVINDPTPAAPADNPFDDTPWISAISAARTAKKWLTDPSTSVWWYNGASEASATVTEWWDGASLQPATLEGWWDGAAIQPLS